MISGRYLDGQTAASVPATLEFADGLLLIRDVPQPFSVSLTHVKVSERIANITRRIRLPNGGVFETEDNDAVDLACEALGIRGRAGFVHWLESRWPVALASLAIVALLAAWFVRSGLPAITQWVAETLPAETDAAIGTGTLETLDQYAFHPSRMLAQRQAELRETFDGMTATLADGHRYDLQFRGGGILGANAFALPSGIVVVTDELVDLAQSDHEIIAVLAHEIGHVRGRHALRQMLQAAGISAMSMALFGDVSSVTGVLGAAPVLLQARHSRDFELEADAFARQWLRDHSIAEANFDAILCRMSGEQSEAPELSFFSTHPPIRERADCAR